MKLTKQRLIEIVKEEYQKILNEKTVRLPDMDVNFKGNVKMIHCFLLRNLKELLYQLPHLTVLDLSRQT